MFEVILLIIGVAAGFCLYKMLIMSDSRQSTISTKILSAVTDKSNTDSSALAVRIREDINNSYRLEFQDLKSCITNYFCSNGTCNKTPDSTSSSEKEYKDDEIEVLLKSKFNFLKDWDIRSLSKRETAVTEEPMAENKADKEAPSSPEKTEPAAESKPKVDEAAAESTPKKDEPAAENKPKQVDDWNKPDEKASSSPKKTEPVAGSKPRKENTSHGGNSRK
jgi:hypothetical protein